MPPKSKKKGPGGGGTKRQQVPGNRKSKAKENGNRKKSAPKSTKPPKSKTVNAEAKKYTVPKYECVKGKGRLTHVLPLTAIAHVLDFLTFEQLISITRTCKRIRYASAQIDTLNIMRGSELQQHNYYIRYSNVTHVNIGCLRERIFRKCKLIPEVTTQIVPFLQLFPKLKGVFIWTGDYRPIRGNYHWSGKYIPRRRDTNITGLHPQDPGNTGIMKALAMSFSEAFKAGTLPSDLRVGTVLWNYECLYSDSENGYGCELCCAICKFFPLRIVADFGYRIDTDDSTRSSFHCMGIKSFLTILRVRKEWNQFVQESYKPLLQILETGSCEEASFEDYFNVDEDEAENLRCDLQEKGFALPYDGRKVWCITSEARGVIEEIVRESGLRPKNIPFTRMINWVYTHGWDGDCIMKGKHLIDQETLEWLIAQGFQMDEKILVGITRDDWEKLHDL